MKLRHVGIKPATGIALVAVLLVVVTLVLSVSMWWLASTNTALTSYVRTNRALVDCVVRAQIADTPQPCPGVAPGLVQAIDTHITERARLERRVAQLEEALRAHGITVPPPLPDPQRTVPTPIPGA